MSFEDFNQSNQLNQSDTNVWYEKYRPKTIDDIILPNHIKNQIKSYLEEGTLPHLGFFSRNPGTGKSSLSKVILNELNAEYMWINASLNKGIDLLRNKLSRFASSAGLTDKVKIVVLDEADYLTHDAQTAFRGFIDEFGSNVRFIFTGNYKDRIIQPLLDRLEVYDFNNFAINDMAKPIFDRLQYILNQEKVQFDPKDIVAIIKSNYPKIRSMIGDLRKFSVLNQLQYTSTSQDNLNQLITLIQNKDVEQLKLYVYSLSNPDIFYSDLAVNVEKINQNIMNNIIIIAKYQDTSTKVKDQHLNLLALCYELCKG